MKNWQLAQDYFVFISNNTLINKKKHYEKSKTTKLANFFIISIK